MEKITNIDIESLKPSPTNPRKQFDAAKITELAESIKAVGIMQPIIVRVQNIDAYEIIAGERRYRACKEAGLTEIPAIVRAMKDDEVLEFQFIENMQRDDLTPMEEAHGFKALIDAKYTVDQIAVKLSKSRAYIYQRMKLLELPAIVTDALTAGTINVSTAILIARINDVEKREEAAKEIIAPEWGHPQGYDEAKETIERLMLEIGSAPFGVEDESLPGGACEQCSKMTRNDVDLFGSDDTARCTDPKCYDAKVEEYRKRLVNMQKEKGFTEVSYQKAESGWGESKQYQGLKENIGSEFLKKGAKTMTWKQAIAGTDAVKYFALDGDCKVTYYVKTAEAIEAAKAAGREIFRNIKTSTGNSSQDYEAQRAAEEEQRNKNTAIVTACAEQVVKAVEKLGAKAPAAAVELIAEWLSESYRIERRGAVKTKDMKTNELAAYLVELVLWNHTGYDRDYSDKEFVAICKLFGVDIKAAKKEGLARYAQVNATKTPAADEDDDARENHA